MSSIDATDKSPAVVDEKAATMTSGLNAAATEGEKSALAEGEGAAGEGADILPEEPSEDEE